MVIFDKRGKEEGWGIGIAAPVGREHRIFGNWGMIYRRNK